jgi:hypothetical protein
VPRFITVLRLIDQLDPLDGFINDGITDIWFPFTDASLRTKLSLSARLGFQKCQSIVLTPTLNVEKGNTYEHTHFSQDELVPFDRKEHLGRGGFGTWTRLLAG